MDIRSRTALFRAVAPVVIAVFFFSCAGVSVSPVARADFEAGLAFFNQGRFQEALPYFEKAVAAEPDFYEARLYLGRTHLNMKNYAKAVPCLRSAYRLCPEDFKRQVVDILIDALLGAAFSELGKDNFESSLTYLREVLSVDPGTKKVKDEISNILVTVATGLFMKGEVREAVKVYTDAIKANPDNTKAYLGLAKALIKSGALAEAARAAQKALGLDPTSREALNILKELIR